jgi:hypothetical protein
MKPTTLTSATHSCRSARIAGYAGAVLLSLTPQIAHANKKSPALPAAMFVAKTIYIDNQTSDAGLQNYAHMGLAKWGHFQVVDSAQKADVVLRLTGTSYAQSVPSDTPPDLNAKPATTRAGNARDEGVLPGGDQSAPDGFTRLTLVDPKSGEAWWSDLRKTNHPQEAARIVDGLREAFEQGLKARGK